MDAVKFLEEKDRMTNGCNMSCEKCPMSHSNNGYATKCSDLTNEQEVHIVEEWSKNHPRKTRQSELLKLFPKTVLDKEGIVVISPCNFLGNNGDKCKESRGCTECRKKFWLEEIEEDE